MSKMVIEVPDQFVEVGRAMAEHLAMLQRTKDRLGGGKAVDYAAVEAAIAEGASRTELAAHGAILKSLDIDVPAVVWLRNRPHELCPSPPTWFGARYWQRRGNLQESV